MRLNPSPYSLSRAGQIWLVLGVLVAVCPFASAVEHVTLKNGFELDCVRREIVGDKVRLYLTGKGSGSTGDSSYLEVAADSVVRVETVPDVPEPAATVKMPSPVTIMTAPTKEEMHEMLAHAGAQHNIDEDLLASVVRAESGGQVRAVSRAGARGLIRFVPGTASAMGGDGALRREENVPRGDASLHSLLTRYR